MKKMRWIAGAALVALFTVACGRSATGAEVDGPRFGRNMSEVIDTPAVDGDTTTISTGGYFGSGHTNPKPDTAIIVRD